LEKSTEILRKYWGYDSFRPLQEDIVDSVIYGHDTLAILPTGGGKSICFQVPGLALNGITIVISPLIALMQDQVQNLQSKGIYASMITGSMSYREIDIALDNARFGKTKFLYTSPERLKSELFLERFKRMDVGLIVVDEAHCISEWGHDFRPSYSEIANIREHHPEAPVIAVTASATTAVQKDIIKSLKLKKPNHFVGSLERNNISYNIVKTENKLNKVISYCKDTQGQTGIVYCQTRRSVKQVVTQLRAHSVSAGIYHGGLSAEDRKYMLKEWMEGRLKVMVATNAFGMGIDKPDVRFVLHYEIPNNLEAYYQEAGRAGRDGNESKAIALWEEHDLELMKNQLIQRYPEKDRIKTIYNSITNYLKVAIGSGKDESYPFNIHAFSNAFEISISETFYALKILQLNGTLSFTESSFHPTRLKMAIGNKALYNFQIGHSKVAKLITLLTRSYPGIFDRFITIHENELAKRLDIPKQSLTEKLKYLEQYGVIDINFQSQLPLITFITERLPDTHFSISPKIYLARKSIEESKLDAIIEFMHSNECRSQFIATYFGGNVEKCGKCDICTHVDLTSIELKNQIFRLLPSDLNKLESEIQTTTKEIHEALRILLLEEQIVYLDGIYQIPNS
jgi:ATP-dependent DNA helicase RecQ